jgi:colanic acid/amylovoran biosynthesis protein
MNFGTPAIAINYEHKSAGIMQQLGMPEMAVDIRHLLDGSLGAMVGDTLGQLPAINERLAVAVKAEREKGIGMVKSVLDRVGRGNEGWFLLTEISAVVRNLCAEPNHRVYRYGI